MDLSVMVFVGVGSDGQLWSTTRFYDGDWQPSFDQPTGGAGDPGFRDVYGAGVGDGVFHFVAIGTDGKLWHTLRAANGYWQASINPVASVSAGGPASFSGVGCAGDGSGGLNVVGVGSDGQLWHTARRNDGTWFSSFDPVSSHSKGGPGDYTAVSAAGSGGPTQIVAVGADGRLWHTIRHPDNSWQPTMGDVAKQSAGGPPSFTRVACSGDSSGGLNVVAVGSDNQLWHTARRSDGTWFAQFEPVSGKSGGGPATVLGVGAGNDTNNDMQVVVIAPGGALWHTIRHNAGSWQPNFGQVPTTGGPPQFAAITPGSGAIPDPRVAQTVEADIDGDGQLETVEGTEGGYTLVLKQGTTLWNAPSPIDGWNREPSDIFLPVDVDQDGRQEILIANNGDGWTGLLKWDGQALHVMWASPSPLHGPAGDWGRHGDDAFLVAGSDVHIDNAPGRWHAICDWDPGAGALVVEQMWQDPPPKQTGTATLYLELDVDGLYRPQSEDPLGASDPQNAQIVRIRNQNTFGVDLEHIYAGFHNIPDNGSNSADFAGQDVIGEYTAQIVTSIVSSPSAFELLIDWTQP